MNKQFVSLDQALSYLQFINKDPEAFSDKGFKLPPTSDTQKNKPVLIRKPSAFDQIKIPNKNEQGNNQQNQGKRTLNKNRAIKRIIDTSKQILQAHYRYQQPIVNDKKSYVTQFNIYLKQYNRLSEQILAQEHQRQQKKRQFIQHEESKLENLYSYTVQQDFRDIVEVSILKDKINKSNVQMVMETFKQCLVVLRPNQLKLYEKMKEDFSRDIKLHQIQNVDYFTQPYIFTVMTIVKDKSSTSQFLCFRFDSVEKQHKWDRAIYCNYIVRKMKQKRKYFLLEFPEKQEEKQGNQGLQHVIKKRDDVRNYQIDRKKVIKNLMSQKQKQGTRMGTAGMDSQRDLPTTEKRDNKIQRFNTENQINVSISPKRQNANYNMMSTKNADQKNIFESSVKGSKRKNQNNDNQQEGSAAEKGSRINSTVRQNPNQNANGSGNNTGSVSNTGTNPVNTKTTVQPQQNPPQSQQQPEQKNNENDIRQSNKGTENILPIFLNPNLGESEVSADVDMKAEQNKIINPYTKRKIQLKQKYQKGILVQKIKFFIDKPKMIYLGNEELQYWDYEVATKHKTEKKIITFKEIKKYKVVKTDKTQYIQLQLTSKTLQFAGKAQQLQQLIQWIQLPSKQKQFELQLANRNKIADPEDGKSIKNNDKLIF